MVLGRRAHRHAAVAPHRTGDRRVVALGAAAREHDLAGQAPDDLGDPVTGVVDGPTPGGRSGGRRSGWRSRRRGTAASPRWRPDASAWSPHGRGRRAARSPDQATADPRSAGGGTAAATALTARPGRVGDTTRGGEVDRPALAAAGVGARTAVAGSPRRAPRPIRGRAGEVGGRLRGVRRGRRGRRRRSPVSAASTCRRGRPGRGRRCPPARARASVATAGATGGAAPARPRRRR